MPPTFEQKIQHFHRTAIEKMQSLGLSAYVLNENGSVLRVRPDGSREYIVLISGSSVKMASDIIDQNQNDLVVVEN